MAPIDRPRGILSEADRKYLTNPDEYSDQGAYERRQAIIERVHEALHDFPLLTSELDEVSRAEAFEDRDLENKEHTLNVLSSAFAFLYLGITDTVEPNDLAKDAFEDMVGDGVKRAYLQRGESVRNVAVNIEVETGPPLKELQTEEILELPEIFQLLESGAVSGEEAREQLNRLLQEKGEEPIDDAFEGAATKIPTDALDPLFEPLAEDADRPEDTEE
jgi:hypothetical protein